jgi:regulator of RNase E activity RraA
MSAGAIAQGALGAVISGRIRDLAEHTSPPQDRPFPIFARGHSTLGQAPFTRVAALNVPVTIAPPELNVVASEDGFPSVTVHPGDYVVADADGVVCVPRDLWERVVERAGEGREVDGKCLESIKNGEGVGAAFKKWRGK